MEAQIFQGERKSTRKDIQVGGHKSKLKKKKKANSKVTVHRGVYNICRSKIYGNNNKRQSEW